MYHNGMRLNALLSISPYRPAWPEKTLVLMELLNRRLVLKLLRFQLLGAYMLYPGRHK